MKFYGRLAPGVLTDFETPLEVVLQRPRKATSDVVVKIWERASCTDIDGRFVEDSSADDLLAELHGDVEDDPTFARRNRGKLVVRNVVIPQREAKTPLGVVKIKVAGGDEVYEAPIPSTDAELQAQNFELSLSIEHAGSEVFRSKVTTFIRPALHNPKVRPKRLVGFQDDGTIVRDHEDEVMFAGRYATIGTTSSTHDDGKLIVLGLAIVAEDGRLAPCDADGRPREGELTLLRTQRNLFAHLTREVPRAAKTAGPSGISMRLCHRIEADGSIAVDVPYTHSRYHFGHLDPDDK